MPFNPKPKIHWSPLNQCRECEPNDTPEQTLMFTSTNDLLKPVSGSCGVWCLIGSRYSKNPVQLTFGIRNSQKLVSYCRYFTHRNHVYRTFCPDVRYMKQPNSIPDIQQKTCFIYRTFHIPDMPRILDILSGIRDMSGIWNSPKLVSYTGQILPRTPELRIADNCCLVHLKLVQRTNIASYTGKGFVWCKVFGV